MKKLNKSIIIVLFTIFMVAFLSTQVWAISLSFNPSASEIDVGDSVDIDIVISGLENDNLAGFDLIFNFEDSILAFDSYTLGTELGVIPWEALDWSLGNNLFEVSWISPISDFWSNQPDSFTLATISFIGISGGISDLSFSNVTLIDEYWRPSLLTDASLGTGSVDVAAPVPEPATMLLFGTGLAGLVGFRKKFKK